MNLDKVNKWLMLAANVGVIAGILFLAVEIQQNSALLEAEARAKYTENSTSAWILLLNDTDPAPLLIKDRNGEELTELESFKLNVWWMVVLFAGQYSFLELPEVETGWINTTANNWQTYPSFRQTWQGSSKGAKSASSSAFDERFIKYFNENIVNR